LARDQQATVRSIAPAALKTLEKYHWPGNVRELENAIRRALVMAKGEAILGTDLPAEITGQITSVSPGAAGPSDAAVSDIAGLARQLFQWARRDPKLKIIP